MTNALVQPDRASFTTDEAYRDAQQMYGLLTGQTAWGAPTSFTSLEDDAVYSMTVQNQGTGGHINVPGLFLVNDSGVNAGVIDVTTLNVSGTATIETLHVEGNTDLDGTLNVDGATTIDDTLHVTGSTDLDSTLNVDGNTALGNGNADTLTVIGLSTFRNSANSATQLYVDAGNNRVIVGSSTALSDDDTPALHVVGRLYVAPESANDLAIQVRRSSATATGFHIGVTSTNDLAFKDDTDTEVFRVGDGGSAFQAKVTGALNVTNGISVNASGILISAGGLGVTGSSVFNSGLSVLGGLTVTTGLLTVTGGQIEFPSTQVPSANVNTLDDYEEGTWTPNLGGSESLSVASGTYTKIGRQVSLVARIVVTSIGTGSVSTISGLPFTVGSLNAAVAVGYWGTSNTNYVFMSGLAVNGSATIQLQATAAAAASLATASFFKAGSEIQFTCTYFV